MAKRAGLACSSSWQWKEKTWLRSVSPVMNSSVSSQQGNLFIQEHQGRENSMISRRSSLTEEAAKACGDDSGEKEPGAPRTYYGGDSDDQEPSDANKELTAAPL
jgi:hypothetical protein